MAGEATSSDVGSGPRGLALAGVALGLLWALDMAITGLALGQGAQEMGPVMRHVVDGAPALATLLKAVGLAAVLFMGARLRDARAADLGLGAVGAVSIGIVTWNLLVLLQLVGAASA